MPGPGPGRGAEGAAVAGRLAGALCETHGCSPIWCSAAAAAAVMSMPEVLGVAVGVPRLPHAPALPPSRPLPPFTCSTAWPSCPSSCPAVLVAFSPHSVSTTLLPLRGRGGRGAGGGGSGWLWGRGGLGVRHPATHMHTKQRQHHAPAAAWCIVATSAGVVVEAGVYECTNERGWRLGRQSPPPHLRPPPPAQCTASPCRTLVLGPTPQSWTPDSPPATPPAVPQRDVPAAELRRVSLVATMAAAVGGRVGGGGGRGKCEGQGPTGRHVAAKQHGRTRRRHGSGTAWRGSGRRGQRWWGAAAAAAVRCVPARGRAGTGRGRRMHPPCA